MGLNTLLGLRQSHLLEFVNSLKQAWSHCGGPKRIDWASTKTRFWLLRLSTGRTELSCSGESDLLLGLLSGHNGPLAVAFSELFSCGFSNGRPDNFQGQGLLNK